MIRYSLKPSSWIWGIYRASDMETGKIAKWLVLGPIAICLSFR